jgi:light-regulated signal transduction histidine kinase (bacteriophytochrome)
LGHDLRRSQPRPSLEAGRGDGELLDRSIGVARSALAVVSPEALQAALDVVLDNALKFAPEGSRVVVDVRYEDGGPVIVVHDEGPGLDEDELSRAGDRFWRSRRDQNVDGSGLGLAMPARFSTPSGAGEGSSRLDGAVVVLSTRVQREGTRGNAAADVADRACAGLDAGEPRGCALLLTGHPLAPPGDGKL